MHRIFAAVILGTAVAGAALAHQGVKNPAVMARMKVMENVGSNMKVLGEMTKGTREFDAEVARAAAARIAEYAAKTPASFEAREDDPKSEARPLIWEQFDDFTALAGEMETLAKGYAGNIETRGDVQEALKALGKTCTACHKPYRE